MEKELQSEDTILAPRTPSSRKSLQTASVALTHHPPSGTNALQPSEHFSFISGSNTPLSHTKGRSQPSSPGLHTHRNSARHYICITTSVSSDSWTHMCWFSLVLTFLMKLFFPLAYFISNTFYFTISLLVNWFKSFVQWNIQIHVKTYIWTTTQTGTQRPTH